MSVLIGGKTGPAPWLLSYLRSRFVSLSMLRKQTLPADLVPENYRMPEYVKALTVAKPFVIDVF